MSQTATIKILSSGIPGYFVGQEVRVSVDQDGTPNGETGRFWRRKLRDAHRDRCVEIVKKVDKKPPSRKKLLAQARNSVEEH